MPEKTLGKAALGLVLLVKVLVCDECCVDVFDMFVLRRDDNELVPIDLPVAIEQSHCRRRLIVLWQKSGRVSKQRRM
jgi:hypothetical protein